MAGLSRSIDGDVTGNHGNYDLWVIKLGILPDGVTGVKNSITDFSLYQNLNNETIDVSFFANGNEKLNMQLFDITGRALLQQTITASPGFNKQELQPHDISTGIYLVRMQSDGGAITKKLFVQ